MNFGFKPFLYNLLFKIQKKYFLRTYSSHTCTLHFLRFFRTDIPVSYHYPYVHFRVYHVWGERNARIFQHKSLTVDLIISKIKNDIRARINSWRVVEHNPTNRQICNIGNICAKVFGTRWLAWSTLLSCLYCCLVCCWGRALARLFILLPWVMPHCRLYSVLFIVL